MNAHKFVKEKGIEVAKDVVADYPYSPTFYNGSMDDLKRIVESHELVEKCGGIDACKRKVDKQKQKPSKRFICWVDCNGKNVTVYEMLQAIADVEACQ